MAIDDVAASPIQPILAQSDTLAPSAEQRLRLALLDMDFRVESTRISSARRLLELDVLRKKTSSSSFPSHASGAGAPTPPAFLAIQSLAF